VDALHLVSYLEHSAARWPDRLAVTDPVGPGLTYAELRRQVDQLAGFLARKGVTRGDRVGVVVPKTTAAVVAQFAIMKSGAAYVPVDASAPVERSQRILADCRVRAVFVDDRTLAAVPDGADTPAAGVVSVGMGQGSRTDVTRFGDALAAGGPPPEQAPGLDDLAYILYTSGSTGMPKGVMLTHRNAVSFVDWCSDAFSPTEEDRFSSHAPFHFDLSVLDIYLSIKHGASLFLIPEALGKSPKDLARFIEANRLTVWYSTPSILTLLLEHGQLDSVDASGLRLVFFAGEVFPVKHLRELKRRWPAPAYYNLYGPTETNVCTFARIPARVPDDREEPYPIGPPCSHCRGLVLDQEGREVAVGQEGLLYISGDSVFRGYWNRPAENAAAFREIDGVRWYNTGDVVRWQPDEGYVYVGRRDRMVKRRGYRIELGEIERAIYRHPRVHEAAVVAVPDADAGVRIVAFVTVDAGGPAPSIIELKTFCSRAVPAYMSPDRFIVRDRLPKTSTDKIAYQVLREELVGAGTETSPRR
jgi:amino acid adenylation domain-containing protein